MNDFAPIKTCKSQGRSNPFITPEIKSLMKLGDYSRALARKTDDPFSHGQPTKIQERS